MFSIIVCSISPERLSNLSQNIHDTIGVEYELIGIDNRTKKWPIAKVYNEGARQARYPYLFFVHEDVKFHTKDWGQVILEKLQEPDCGAIGFAGSKVKLKAYSGWPLEAQWGHTFMYQGGGPTTYFGALNVCLENPFEEVITLDGLGIFVAKKLWESYPFDEKLLTGFHCYDLDFSLQIAATKKYKNYVCCSYKVIIEHFSLGNCDERWMQEVVKMHTQKWYKILPMTTGDLKLNKKEEARLEEKWFNKFMREVLKSNYPDKKTLLREFVRYPYFSWKHVSHCISNIKRYSKVSRAYNKYYKAVCDSTLFDKTWYLEQYPEVANSNIEPALHYFQFGWKEGKNPSKDFCTTAYLHSNPDIISSKMNPLTHYELHGRKEHRKIFSIAEVENGKIKKDDVLFVENAHKTSKTVLLISHELTLTGAPRALLGMAIIMKDMGVTPVIVSPKPGPMEEEINRLGIKLKVAPLFSQYISLKDEFTLQFLSLFDIVLFNTLLSTPLVQHMTNISAKKIAWLHEGSFSYNHFARLSNIQAIFDSLDYIYTVGDYARSFAEQYIKDKKKLSNLLYGIPDMPPITRQPHKQLTFMLAGTLCKRKGQRVLLKALWRVPWKIRKNIKIYLAGAPIERKTVRAIKRCPFSCIEYLGEMNHDELMKVYSKTDVILCPSLDDPMPIVCTEAMIFAKPIIVSENTGTASLIENGIHGYRIPANSPIALAKAICRIVEHKERIPEWGKNARQIYEKEFTMEMFAQNIKEMIVNI